MSVTEKKSSVLPSPAPVLSAPVPPQPPAPSASTRMAPALVAGHRILVECPAWCVVDHVDLHEQRVEDVTHWGEFFGTQVSTLLDENTAYCELFGRVNADPSHPDPRMRAAHVLVGNGSLEDAFLTPDMADETADELIEFAVQLKAAARVARAANQGLLTA
ncbi:DUF6907 domain-containing protein [Streptomyces cyaneofuscatus]|uniref:DUF6907 domain-containing protein n=1 Tax=Streptomyces cyaneofuscatus TaxID=66883 RepID=UPI0036DBCFBA